MEWLSNITNKNLGNDAEYHDIEVYVYFMCWNEIAMGAVLKVVTLEYSHTTWKLMYQAKLNPEVDYTRSCA